MNNADRDDVFKMIRYSFLFAMAMFIVFVMSFLIIFHVFFEIDESQAITTGGPTDKNTDISQQWEVIQVEDRNAESRIRIRNINSGTNASAAIVVLNDAGTGPIPNEVYDTTAFHFTAFGLASTGNTQAGGFGADSGSIFHSAPGPFAYINLYDDFFVWKTNPSDDGLLSNTIEHMRLTADGKLAIGTPTPHASALLHMSSVSEGFMPPAMTTTQRDLVVSPITGLQLFNTTTNQHEFYNGTVWGAMGGAGGGGSGDVVGPTSAANNAIVRFDGTTGKLVQNSGVTISDTNEVFIPNTLEVGFSTATDRAVQLSYDVGILRSFVGMNGPTFDQAIAIDPNDRVGIGVGTAVLGFNVAAKFIVTSTTEGFLPPRWTALQETNNTASFGTPERGLMWFNTTINQWRGWNGTTVGPVNVPLFQIDGNDITTINPLANLIIAGHIRLEDDIYDSSWDGLEEAPTKNAVFDKIESLSMVTDISVKVTKTTDQSIVRNTLTMVTWDSEKYDTDDMHDNVTNNSRITFNTAGKYSVLAQSEWGINSGGFRFMDIMKNGVDSIARVRNLAENASEHNIAFVGEFAVGDYIQLEVFQDTGGNLDFESGAILENTYLEAHKIN